MWSGNRPDTRWKRSRRPLLHITDPTMTAQRLSNQ
jgi:hypothetical protein